MASLALLVWTLHGCPERLSVPLCSPVTVSWSLHPGDSAPECPPKPALPQPGPHVCSLLQGPPHGPSPERRGPVGRASRRLRRVRPKGATATSASSRRVGERGYWTRVHTGPWGGDRDRLPVGQKPGNTPRPRNRWVSWAGVSPPLAGPRVSVDREGCPGHLPPAA